ncbi:MAG: hypothetical protein RLZZ143_654 [Cyanobacteriota bacterium]|jgi:uncharacterized protein YjbI with pentapeptide repeats
MAQAFSRRELQGQSFRGQNLSHADFSYADIRGADFTDAILIEANFSHAITGLRPQAIFILLVVLYALGSLAVFTIGVIATFAGKVLLPNDSFQGITYLALINLLALLVFFAQIILGELAVAILTSVIASFASFIVLLLAYQNLTAAVAIASDILWMVILAITGVVIFTTTIAITENDRRTIAGSGFIAWLTAVAVVGVIAPTEITDVLGIAKGVGTASALGVLLCLYVSQQALTGNDKFAWVWKIARSFVTPGGTRFRGANLTDANFTQAKLNYADFRAAILTRTDWFQAEKLNRSRHEGTYLEDAMVQKLVTTRSGRGRDFAGRNLQGVNLQGADLVDANFIDANLNEANLQGADLSNGKLVRSQLYRTNLTKARLTGAYIQDWGISPETKLDGVECLYLYMRLPTPDDPDPFRKPDQRSQVFTVDDFADFITPIIKTMGLYYRQNVDPRQVAEAFKTLDLYHAGAVDPGAAAIALQQISQQYPEAGLELIALEGQGGDRVRVHAKIDDRVDRSQLSAEYFARYEKIRSLPAADIQALLAGTAEKDDRIRSLENMVMTAISSQKFYAETYYNFGETMTEHKGNVNISGVQGNVSGIAAAGENQTMTGVALGQISGAVTNTIGQLQSANTPEATQLATLLEQLQSAIEHESHLAPEDKAEAMEQVKTLAAAGQNPEDNVLQKAAKTALKILKGTIAGLPDAAKLVESCAKLLPAITTLLSLI